MRWVILATALLMTTSLLIPAHGFAEEPALEDLLSASTGTSTYSADADKLDTEFLHSAGEFNSRFSIDFDAVGGFGADGEISLPDDFNIGFSGGLGYFPIEQVSADMALSTALVITEETAEVNTFTITPGSYIYPIPQLFLRVGVPLTPTNDPMTVAALGGVGYEIPVSDSQNLIGEVAFTYPFTGDVPGTVSIGGGTSFSF